MLLIADGSLSGPAAAIRRHASPNLRARDGDTDVATPASTRPVAASAP